MRRRGDAYRASGLSFGLLGSAFAAGVGLGRSALAAPIGLGPAEPEPSIPARLAGVLGAAVPIVVLAGVSIAIGALAFLLWRWVRRRTADLNCAVARIRVQSAALERDGHGRRHAAAALREREAQYCVLVEALPVSVIIVQDRKIAFANRVAAETLGLTCAEDLIGESPSRFRLDREPCPVMPGGEPPPDGVLEGASGDESVLTRANGEEFPSQLYVTATSFKGKPAEQIVGIDVTERRRSAEALRDSEERLALAMAATSDGLWDRNVQTGKTYFSPRWYTMLGYEPSEMAASHETWLQLLHPDDRDEAEEGVRDLIEGKRDGLEAEFRLKTKSGGWRWILSRGRVAQRDARGAPLRVIGTHIDVSGRKAADEQRKKLESQILRGQKLEGLGILAGGIAHDFNNLLTGIMGNAGICMLDLPPASPVRENIEDIQALSERAAKLCRQILAYSGKAQVVAQAADLSELVEETVALLRGSISQKARVSLVLAEGLLPVKADTEQLRQVVLSLLNNSAEAISDSCGAIEVSTARVECDLDDLAKCHLGLGRAAGPYAQLRVSDNGCGIDTDAVDRIFDPFYSTKFVGRGLGLAAVLGIVRAHNGVLRVETAVGKGSVFDVLLPVTQDVPS